MFGQQQTKAGKGIRRLLRDGRYGVSVISAVLCFGSGAALAVDKDLGTWLNSENKGKIQLRECGNESLCGQIVWLKDPVDENGKPWRDILNPDPKLKKREVVGIDVMINTKKIAPMTWQGHIYDPEVGKTYYLKHLKIGSDKVEIKGCLPAGWPCRTKYWTRTDPVNTPSVAKKAPAQAPRVAAAPPPAPRNTAPPPAPRNTAPPPAPSNTPPPAPQNTEPAPTPRVASRPPAPAPAQPQAQQPRQQPSVTAAVPPASSARGGYLVQVAARQSHNEAMAAFNDLQRQYPQLLGGLSPEVIRADLGQRGVWYRVGVGPMLQQQAALNFCNQLKSAGADCLIRRR